MDREQISPNVLEERIEGLSVKVDDFRKDTRLTLSDILNEIRGFSGRLQAQESKSILTDQNLATYEIVSNNRIDLLEKESASTISRLMIVENIITTGKGQKDGISLVWKVLIGVVSLALIILNLVSILFESRR